MINLKKNETKIDQNAKHCKENKIKLPTFELIPYFFAVIEFNSINLCAPNIEIEGEFICVLESP